MAERIIYVGGMAELEEFVTQYRGRLVSQGDYVFGRWCDLTAETDLIWEDFYAVCRKAKLTSKQRFACQEYMKLEPIAEIARKMGRDWDTVQAHIKKGFARLDALGTDGLGCLTCIVEDCGGWEAVHDFIANIN